MSNLSWARGPSNAQALAMGLRIILACEKDSTNTQIARDLGVSRSAVTKWRNRFVEDRLDGIPEPTRTRGRADKTPQVERWLAAHPRFAPHFTPTNSSWRNLVERWFA